MAFGLDDAIAAGLKVLNKFIPDPEARAKAETEFRGALLEWDKGQLAVNAVEAANPSIFVSGWRPFIGWVCGCAVAYQFVLVPVGGWLLMALGASSASLTLQLAPKLDDQLWQLLTAMLGMAGLRTYEKMKEVARV
jgi:hypothetical protein